MALRNCNGNDLELVRVIKANDFDAACMNTVPGPAMEGLVAIACNCGLMFDEEYRSKVYPHEFKMQSYLFPAY